MDIVDIDIAVSLLSSTVAQRGHVRTEPTFLS